MKPEDLERIRAHYTKGGNFLAYAEADVLALCDALEQAWAERDEQYEYRVAAYKESRRLLARAERTEAELAFQRKWCADNLGLMPPTREQNDTFLAALEGDQQ